ncbi:MAG TPA: sugar ABC transporter permease [Devosia sp.]|jgi:ABC-type sugar transport system permease subunit|uniref:carbohydrate ABC transporter permease n=1 Tax=Devosia sp. TaxID=1871048 RepID=UPI002DDD8CD5|nr:sugar ABC transporter permease [Devosia sp.]HEV2514352.1 sugar ABC transporter permease [Devosia sp.]
MAIATRTDDTQNRWRLPNGFRVKIFAYALVAPVVLLILGLVAYPFLFAIYVSFTDQVVGSVGNFIGFKNFEYLAGTATFWSAIWNTIVLVLVSDALKLFIGLGLALLVHQNLPGRGLFRSFLMLPWAMPAFVAFLIWRVLYQPIGGGINLILTQTGLYPQVIDWLGQRSTAMGSVIVASVWRGFPFWFVSILAALQSVPKELHEAAVVDGANIWQRFWTVTVPGILPVVIITMVLSSIWTANAFEHVWLLTAGGPSDATMVFPVLAYFGMQTQRIGEAAAVSVYMLPVLAILVLFATSLMMRKED